MDINEAAAAVDLLDTPHGDPHIADTADKLRRNQPEYISAHTLARVLGMSYESLKKLLAEGAVPGAMQPRGNHTMWKVDLNECFDGLRGSPRLLAATGSGTPVRRGYRSDQAKKKEREARTPKPRMIAPNDEDTTDAQEAEVALADRMLFWTLFAAVFAFLAYRAFASVS